MAATLQHEGERTMNRKRIARILAGLALTGSMAAATGLGTGAPLARAAAGTGTCAPIRCYYQPTSLTLSHATGTIVIRGAYWAPNDPIKLDFYHSNSVSVDVNWVQADSYGSFVLYYYEGAPCPNSMIVVATDILTNNTATGSITVC
jgi:hypothetical protein